MTDLTQFASLPIDELTVELERMIAAHHAPTRSYAERIFSTTAGNGTVNPLTADPVVGGDYSRGRA